MHLTYNVKITHKKRCTISLLMLSGENAFYLETSDLIYIDLKHLLLFFCFCFFWSFFCLFIFINHHLPWLPMHLGHFLDLQYEYIFKTLLLLFCKCKLMTPRPYVSGPLH